MNTTVNGSSFWSCSSLINPEALKIELTVAYSFILVVSLVGNFLIVLVVYKTPSLRKTDKYVDRKYGHIRPALSNNLVPGSTGRFASWLVAYR